MTAATVRSFIDTNVLVYADDGSDPAKQATSVDLIEAHLRARSGVISTQVLQEFVNVALRKLRLPMDLIRNRLRLYGLFEVVPASAAMVSDALELHAQNPLSFWDALIVQAAYQSGCVQLLTEDLAAGAIVNGVRIVNPFASVKTPTA